MQTSRQPSRCRLKIIFHSAYRVLLALSLSAPFARAGGEFATVSPILAEFCFDCHGQQHAEAKVNLEGLATAPDLATNFRVWRKVVEMLEKKKMPPSDANQPSEAQQQLLMEGIRAELRRAAHQHAHDPGPVVLRRLTSDQYAYTIHDLTGLDLRLQQDFVDDAVGGEGFTNVGEVQFMQDSTLERYLDAAKQVAQHLVIGAGRLSFYQHPGKTGFELSAINRVQNIYRKYGFRTAAGEGGKAFGLERFPRAFFTAWRFRYRNELGRNDVSLADLADEEGIEARFAEYISSVLNQGTHLFPMSYIVEQWQALPKPDGQSEELTKIRAECERIHRIVHNWQTRFGQNSDATNVAPVLDADSFDVAQTKLFKMTINWPTGSTEARIRIHVTSANRDGRPNAIVIWKKPSIQFHVPDRRFDDLKPLMDFLSPQDALRLRFGSHPVAETTLESTDFVTIGTEPTTFVLPITSGASSARFTVEAELDVAHGDDCIVHCSIAQEHETDQGMQISALLANPQGDSFRDWKTGVLEFARILPPISHREPAPSDVDPISAPFDNSHNNPERNHFHYKIKYHRDDQFLIDNILDETAREQLDHAWHDLLGSFEYHDAFLRFVATKYNITLGDHSIRNLEPEWVEGLSEEPRWFAQQLQQSFRSVQTAFESARLGHLDDVIEIANAAWRRPLTAEEKDQLRLYYEQLRDEMGFNHPKAIRTLLTRVLMAPHFIYHTERPHAVANLLSAQNQEDQVVPLSDWELASRLSYFLWSSIPDDELRRAAEAGDLREPKQVAEQASRMLRDPKARRLANQFFGQWFGFYRFDRYRGVDPHRFPEFSDGLKAAMYEEAVLFFEYIIRNDRPVHETLFADYAFVNRELAGHYGIDREITSTDHVLVENVEQYHRGGLLGLAATLTVTSAPRRTSPVKRGDWILRRVLGTPVPPPPADVGAIPVDDVLADGLTIRERLAAHRRERSCQNCHARIDPLGFALEQYDAIGIWREVYGDGQAIDSSGTLTDGSLISGPQGLRDYLRDHEPLFHRTLCTKLVGYALGRAESISDIQLIGKMTSDATQGGYFFDLVRRIVTSRQFRYRRADIDLQPGVRKDLR